MRIIISLHIQPKNATNVPSFSKKWIFANFQVYFQSIQISEVALTLSHHSAVIWSSMVLIFISMDIITLVANTGHQTFRKENPGRGSNNPPSEDVLQKIPQEDEG